MRTSCLALRTSFLRAGIAVFMLVLGLSGCGGGGGAASPTGPGGSTPDTPSLTLLPTITSQPADQSVAIGQTTTLTVAASGVGPFSYEWTRDGVVIAGATGPSYTVPAAKAGDSGAVWRVSVANANGVTVSRPALITVGGSGERTFIGDPAAYIDQSERSLTFPTSIALDGAGNVYATVFPGVLKISTRGVATVLPGLSTTGGLPLCFLPQGVAFDRTGNLYLLCDSAVYKLTPGGEKILLAGSPDSPGNVDGKGTAARFLALSALVVNDSGVLYVADNGNRTLRRIDPDGTVSTVAGSGTGASSADGTGPSARFRVMKALALDPQGNVLLSDDTAIRKITPAGVVTTVAGALSSIGKTDGSVADARFFQLEGIVVDTAGNIFVADSFLNTIRKVTPDGQVVTVAGQRDIRGTADGVGPAAMFAQPQRLAMDKLGNIFVYESSGTIRKMTPGAVVTTFYGNTMLPASSSTVMARGHEGASSWYVTGMSINPANEVLFSSYNAVLKASAPGDVRLFAQSTSTILTFGPTVLAVPMEIGEQFNALAAGRNLTYAVVGESRYESNPKRRLIKFDAAGKLTPIVIGADSSVTGEPEVTGIAVDADDNAYVAMVRNHVVCVAPNPCVQQNLAAVYRVAPDGAAVQLLSSASAYPDRGDLSFSAAGGVAVDRSKNVYVADRGNNSVLKISPAGVVSILAGTPGVTGHADGRGAAAQFSGPDAIAADLNGNVFVFDRNNYTIRKIAPNGAVTTIAGTAGSSSFWYKGTDGLLPMVNALAADTAGTLYVATDWGIIKIVP